MAAILIVVVLFMVLGAFATWHHSRQRGYGLSSRAGAALAILVILIPGGRL